MSSAATIRRRAVTETSPSLFFRYLCLALLFLVSVWIQIGAVKTALHYVPSKVPVFMPAVASNVLEHVDSKASAAGLRVGDTLVAINGRPYSGKWVLLDEALKASPESRLAVTVRSSAPGSPDRIVNLLVGLNTNWAGQKPVVFLLVVFVPVFCLVLGFWTVSVRVRDLSAWLLLGVLLSFASLLSTAPILEGWGRGMLTFTASYSCLLEAMWPIFMLLFGFYFPQPLPLFLRPGSRWRWFPGLVVVPFAFLSLGFAAVYIGDLTNYSSVTPLYRILRPVHVIYEVYVYCLVGGFFGFIFAKSSMPIPADAKRRLRLLYWGATAALTPSLLLVLAELLTKREEFPDWLTAIAILPLGLFPITLAYVIVVQRAMDVRVVLRQGLRYGLARNGVRALQALAIAVVALTVAALIGQSRERPQKIIVIAVGLFAFFTIRRVAEKVGAWLDRRFFREAYDTEQVLSELSDGVRSMVEVRSLIKTVAERISETLHTPRVAVLLGSGGSYRAAYALGYVSSPAIVFPVSAGTVKVLERQKEPARVYFDDPHSWIYREPEVTEEDRSRLIQLDAELLLPLSARDKLLGFITLGPKRSDEPYSRTDLRLLKSVATQTGLALENAQLIAAISDEVAQRERLNNEVQIAREVQERLFPQKLLAIPGITYAGACRPALAVGGNYYDFLALPAGRFGIAIGDVSGKGIAAALTMASLQASLRGEVTHAPDNLASLMCNVNRQLRAALSSSRYATFFYGQYDPASRQLSYVNAGHNPPMLFHCNHGKWEISRLEASGTVVGLLEDSSYKQASFAIAPRDVLVAFTDGISEAMNTADEEWGEDRLIDTVQSCLGLPPAEIISCIMRSADSFVAGAKQNDDMTVVVLCGEPKTQE